MYKIESTEKYNRAYNLLASRSQNHLLEKVYPELKKGNFPGDKISEGTIYIGYLLIKSSYTIKYNVNKKTKVITLEKIEFQTVKISQIKKEIEEKDSEFIEILKKYKGKTEKINNLIEELINELENEKKVVEKAPKKYKKLEGKHIITYILSKCIMENEARPTLFGYGIDGEYTIVTNSFMVYKIKSEFEPLNFNYKPGIASFIKNAIKESEFIDGAVIDIDYNDVYKQYENASQKIRYLSADSKVLYEIKLSRGLSIHVNLVYIKEALDVLGKNTKCVIVGPWRPIKLYNKVGDIVYLLPVKTY